MSDLFKHEIVGTVGETDRVQTLVEVLNLMVDGDGAELPLVALIDQLQTALAAIHQEHRESAVLIIKAYGDYVSCCADVKFTRPETDAEFKDRQRWLRGLDRESEREDRAAYQRLKRKYGD